MPVRRGATSTTAWARVVKRDDLPSHLLLGAGAARMALEYLKRQIAEADAWQAVSASADFGAEYPVELPAGAEQERSGLM
jgi:hypothetical protein